MPVLQAEVKACAALKIFLVLRVLPTALSVICRTRAYLAGRLT